jgi:hypothetical protein
MEARRCLTTFGSLKIDVVLTKFVSDLRQVIGFVWVLQFPPPIKLTKVVVNPTCIQS